MACWSAARPPGDFSTPEKSVYRLQASLAGFVLATGRQGTPASRSSYQRAFCEQDLEKVSRAETSFPLSGAEPHPPIQGVGYVTTRSGAPIICGPTQWPSTSSRTIRAMASGTRPAEYAAGDPDQRVASMPHHSTSRTDALSVVATASGSGGRLHCSGFDAAWTRPGTVPSAYRPGQWRFCAGGEQNNRAKFSQVGPPPFPPERPSITRPAAVSHPSRSVALVRVRPSVRSACPQTGSGETERVSVRVELLAGSWRAEALGDGAARVD